jgi:hypothetical protein
MRQLSDYQHKAWDTEFGMTGNGTPLTRCHVLVDMQTGEEIRLLPKDLLGATKLPIDYDNIVLHSFSSGAEFGCCDADGIQRPPNVIDQMVEYRAARNGMRGRGEKTGQLDVLDYYGIDPGITAVEKKRLQQLAIDGPQTPEEWQELLNYCAGDGHRSVALSRKMWPELDKAHPKEMFFRARCMGGFERMRRIGICLDAEIAHAINAQRLEICEAYVREQETEHGWGIFKGLHFVHKAYHDWLRREGIPMEETSPGSGVAKTDDETLLRVAKDYDKLEPLRRCLATLRQVKDFDIPIDEDGRSRPWFDPYGTVSGRTARTGIFGGAKWWRYLIKPGPEEGCAYIDASGHEIGVAAYDSGDETMKADYLTGNFYLRFAMRIGYAPPGATKKTHRLLHAKFKTIALGVNYGRTAFGIAEELDIDIREARHLLRLYAATYPVYFAWRQSHINGLLIPGRTYHTQLGWPYHPGHISGSQASRKGSNARRRGRDPDRMDAQTIGNLPVQAGAADWTQTVIIGATEAELGLAAAIHDGYLLRCHKDDLRRQIDTLILIMQAAGQRLFGIPRMLVEVEQEIYWPHRFDPDPEGKSHRKMWVFVLGAIHRLAA